MTPWRGSRALCTCFEPAKPFQRYGLCQKVARIARFSSVFGAASYIAPNFWFSLFFMETDRRLWLPKTVERFEMELPKYYILYEMISIWWWQQGMDYLLSRFHAQAPKCTKHLAELESVLNFVNFNVQTEPKFKWYAKYWRRMVDQKNKAMN